MHRGIRFLLGITILASPGLRAETPLLLPPMLIEVTRDEAEWRTTPASVSRVEVSDVQGEQGLSLDELIVLVPGVFTLNRHNFAQGLRLSIRGFGARAGFGVRGVRVLVDGIPLTLPDGQTELDALDLGLVERVEVLRGPASALYGNAAGGVLAITTRLPPDDPDFSFELGGGALGARNLRLEAGGGHEHLQGLAALALRELDGYREHAAADSEIASGRLHWHTGAGSLDLTVNALSVTSQDPGALTAPEVQSDRRAAAVNNLRFDAGEEIRQQRLGLSWEAEANDVLQYRVLGWGGQREFANRLPFMAGGQSSFGRDFGGLGGQLIWRDNWQGLPQRMTLGFDIEAQRDDRRRYDNLDGARGAQTLHQRESATGAGLYLEGSYQPAKRWIGSAGLRYDRLQLRVDDRHLADGDNSGARNLRELSQHVALGYQIDMAHLLYVRIGSAFESPTIAELANPAGGGFNPGLEPAHALNHELGLKGEQGDLRYELVLFSIDVDDELLRFELPGQPGRSFFRNAGRSQREGAELSADWVLTPRWRLVASYTYADYRLRQYTQAGNDFSGNEISGIPRQQLHAELRYRADNWYARMSLAAFDRLFADDANDTRVAGYALANIRFGLTPGGDTRWEPYVGVNNILDIDYNDNIRINAGGQRYFEPAPGTTIYAGLKASW